MTLRKYLFHGYSYITIVNTKGVST